MTVKKITRKKKQKKIIVQIKNVIQSIIKCIIEISAIYVHIYIIVIYILQILFGLIGLVLLVTWFFTYINGTLKSCI